MNLLISIVARPIVRKLVALQSFLFSRPRLDVDITENTESVRGQRSLGPSNNQDPQFAGRAIPVDQVKYDLEFYWDYKLRIKNNSSKTAYGIKVESIFRRNRDYLGRIDDLATLREGEVLEVDYKLKHEAAMNGGEAGRFLKPFPGHVEEIEVLISYTNEARKRFYTKFIYTSTSKENTHLLSKPQQA